MLCRDVFDSHHFYYAEPVSSQVQLEVHLRPGDVDTKQQNERDASELIVG